MTFAWDPTLYRRFDDHRSRPFFDLLDQVGAGRPARVVDAGCGPGHLTADLASRWPAAEIVGFDSSESMLDDVPAGPHLRFETGDVRTFETSGYDVIVSNAVLQWVPEAVDVLTRWCTGLPDDGWVAVQTPLNFDAPSHALMREIGADYPGAVEALRDPSAHLTADIAADVLLAAGLATNVWETTYVHVLDGEDPVLTWVSGTGLRPLLAALSDEARAEFEPRYRDALRAAYPKRSDGATLFPFRRLFAVGHRAGPSVSADQAQR